MSPKVELCTRLCLHTSRLKAELPKDKRPFLTCGNAGHLARECPQKPVLAQATAMVLEGAGVPTVAGVIAALEAANGQAAVLTWTEEITNTILAEAYTRRMDEAGQVAGGWFTKPGLLSGKRLWFELDGIHIKYYTQSPGGAADGDQALQTDDAVSPPPPHHRVGPSDSS